MNRRLLFTVVLGISLPFSSAYTANADDRPKGKQGNKPHAPELQRKPMAPSRQGEPAVKRPPSAKQIKPEIVAERLAKIREARIQQAKEAAAKWKNVPTRDFKANGSTRDLNPSAHNPRAIEPRDTSSSGNASNSPAPLDKEWSDRKIDRIIQFREPFDGVVVTKDKNGNIVKVDLADSQIISSPNGNPWGSGNGVSTDENNNQDSADKNKGGDNSGGSTNSNGNNGSSGSGSSSGGSGTSGSTPAPSSNRTNKPSVRQGIENNLSAEASRQKVAADKVGSLYGNRSGAMNRGGIVDESGNPENQSGGNSKFERPILAGTDSGPVPSGWGICYSYTNAKGELVEIYCRPGSKIEDVLGPGLNGDTPPNGGGSGDSNGGGAAGGGAAEGGEGGAAGGAPGTEGAASGTGSGTGGKKKNKDK